MVVAPTKNTNHSPVFFKPFTVTVCDADRDADPSHAAGPRRPPLPPARLPGLPYYDCLRGTSFYSFSQSPAEAAASCNTQPVASAAGSTAAISTLAVSQGHLGGPNASIRAQKGRGFVEISANQGVAHSDLSRMLTFEIGCADSRCAAISALAVSQVHLSSPNAPICARIRKSRGLS